jgi:hypothetical protein
MQSSVHETQWFFNVTAANPAVTWVSAHDSDALGGSEIDATVNCTDLGNNEHWDFGGAIPTLGQYLFIIFIGLCVFLGIRTGVIKIRRNKINPKDISNLSKQTKSISSMNQNSQPQLKKNIDGIYRKRK